MKRVFFNKSLIAVVQKCDDGSIYDKILINRPLTDGEQKSVDKVINKVKGIEEIENS